LPDRCRTVAEPLPNRCRTVAGSSPFEEQRRPVYGPGMTPVGRSTSGAAYKVTLCDRDSLDQILA
jgi:hypothetical protein